MGRWSVEVSRCGHCAKMGHGKRDCPDLALPAIPAPPLEPRRVRLRLVQGHAKATSLTIARGYPAERLTRKEIAGSIEYPEDVVRPRTRGECKDMPRPCPFVSCAHHLYLDVNPETGTIKLNFPHLEVWEMRESCSLDVADRGGITLEEVGAIVNLTRERICQVEVMGLTKIRRHSGDDLRRAG